MGHNSLQVCMDSSDWLQGTIHEESPMESSSPLSGEMLTCSRPLIERRLRPQHDQALKCPRCDSNHTKFCYYNNYSLSQPRYFCKTCRRYWTKGGTLRNIPVGGGCRKNKKVSSKKPNENNHNNSHEHQSPLMSHHNGGGGGGSSASSIMSSHHNPTDLHLSFHPDHHHHHHQMQFSHLNNLMLGSSSNPSNPSFMDRYSGILENSNNSRPIDFMESKLEAIVGNGRNNNNFDFMGSSADHLGIMGGLGSNMGTGSSGGAHGLVVDQPSFHHPFGMMSSSSSSFDGQNGNFMDTCQRLMLPYDHQHQAHHEDLDQDHHHHDHHQNGMDVKPNAKLLSLEWQDHGNKESFGYLNGLGSSWNNVMNNYGPPTTNSLV